MDSMPINKKINNNDKKFIKSDVYKICFSLINQYEMAIAKIGNLIQLRPFPKEISTKEESEAETIEEVKNSKDHLTQLIFSQDHEKPIVDFIKNDIAINVIKKSVRDLLAIIKKGIKIHIIIKNFSYNDLLLITVKNSRGLIVIICIIL